jgi:hypothetical protein
MAVRHHLGARNACDGTHGLLCEECLSARVGARALYQLSRGAERRGAMWNQLRGVGNLDRVRVRVGDESGG